jgi:hypothetical protein
MHDFLAKYNNAAGYILLASVLFSLSLSVAYLAQKDYRRAIYFFLGVLITLSVAL